MQLNPEQKPEEVLPYLKANFEGRLVTDSRSKAGNWLGFTLERIEKGLAIISLTVKPEMTNPFGHIHGGMMALVIDEVIGWAVVSLGPQSHYTTLNLNVDFLYAIREGAAMVAEATVVRAGKKIIHVASEVYDAERRLLARAASNLVVTSMRPA